MERCDGTGDFARRYDTFAQGDSSYFAWLNRGRPLDAWHTTCDAWYTTCDAWHTTCNAWRTAFHMRHVGCITVGRVALAAVSMSGRTRPTRGPMDGQTPLTIAPIHRDANRQQRGSARSRLRAVPVQRVACNAHDASCKMVVRVARCNVQLTARIRRAPRACREGELSDRHQGRA